MVRGGARALETLKFTYYQKIEKHPKSFNIEKCHKNQDFAVQMMNNIVVTKFSICWQSQGTGISGYWKFSTYLYYKVSNFQYDDGSKNLQLE